MCSQNSRSPAAAAHLQSVGDGREEEEQGSSNPLPQEGSRLASVVANHPLQRQPAAKDVGVAAVAIAPLQLWHTLKTPQDCRQRERGNRQPQRFVCPGS